MSDNPRSHANEIAGVLVIVAIILIFVGITHFSVYVALIMLGLFLLFVSWGLTNPAAGGRR